MKFLVGWLLLINKIKIKCKGEKMKKKIKEFTLEELEELAKGKKIFGFRAIFLLIRRPKVF